jgi:hypothetical protein
MTNVIWLPREESMGRLLPQRYAATDQGQTFAMVRPRADDTGWRVSVFPDGNRENAIEVVAASEPQAKRWIERWAANRTISYPAPKRVRMPHEGELPPRKPKGSDDRS